MVAQKERRPLHKRVREHLRAEYLTGSCEVLPSLRDLSRKLEINHATISRALRDLEREGMVEIVPRKGIYPTAKARSIVLDPPPVADKKLRNIEMVVLHDDLHEQLDVASPIFFGMQQEFAAADSESTQAPVNVLRSSLPVSSLPGPERFVAQARERGTAGIVFLGYGYQKFSESLDETRFIFEVSRQLPVVLAGTPHPQLSLDCVYCDPRPQMREFLKRCYEQGLRRFEFFGSGSSQPHQLERHEEFCHFVMRNGLTWNREFLVQESSEQLAMRLRELPEFPEVVVATNTSRAITVAFEAQRRGLRLPDDVQILCFASLLQHAQPLLPYASILLMDEQGVGRQARELLIESIKKPAVKVNDDAHPEPILKRVPARFISQH